MSKQISKSECREADKLEDDWLHFDDDGICERCGGDGVIITCCDDLCVGAGSCMHGDGEIVCPKCGG